MRSLPVVIIHPGSDPDPGVTGRARVVRQIELGLCALPSLRRAGCQGCLAAKAVNLGLTDDWQHMIVSTRVRGHASAAGGTWDLCERSCGGFPSRSNACCDTQGQIGKATCGDREGEVV